MALLRVGVNRMRRHARFHLLMALCAATALAGCVHQWPLPVPFAFDQPETAATRQPFRFEVGLPLAPCSADKLSFVNNPDQCPALAGLRKFAEQRAQTMVQGGATQNFVVSDELWALWQALSDRNLLAQPNFPVNIPNVGAIAKAKRYVPMDSRAKSPPTGRTPLAFSYAGFWWTFWEDGKPRDPDAPATGTPFTSLIVFQNYPDHAADHH